MRPVWAAVVGCLSAAQVAMAQLVIWEIVISNFSGLDPPGPIQITGFCITVGAWLSIAVCSSTLFSVLFGKALRKVTRQVLYIVRSSCC